MPETILCKPVMPGIRSNDVEKINIHKNNRNINGSFIKKSASISRFKVQICIYVYGISD